MSQITVLAIVTGLHVSPVDTPVPPTHQLHSQQEPMAPTQSETTTAPPHPSPIQHQQTLTNGTSTRPIIRDMETTTCDCSRGPRLHPVITARDGHRGVEITHRISTNHATVMIPKRFLGSKDVPGTFPSSKWSQNQPVAAIVDPARPTPKPTDVCITA